MRDRRARQVFTGLAFISPWIIGFLAFTLYPIGASLYYGLTRYDIVSPPIFIGLKNYSDLLFNDRTFRIVLSNTLYLVVFGVPASIATAFLLASLLNNKMLGRPVFRTVFFMPSIVPVVSTAMVWLWLLNTEYGLIDAFLVSHSMRAIPF